MHSTDWNDLYLSKFNKKYLKKLFYIPEDPVFGTHWHNLSDLKAIGNKKSIVMAQTDPFLPFLTFSQT